MIKLHNTCWGCTFSGHIIIHFTHVKLYIKSYISANFFVGIICRKLTGLLASENRFKIAFLFPFALILPHRPSFSRGSCGEPWNTGEGPFPTRKFMTWHFSSVVKKKFCLQDCRGAIYSHGISFAHFFFFLNAIF